MLKTSWGGGKTLNYLLAGVIALAASGAWEAQAATAIYYKGGTGSESSPINFLLTDPWTGSNSYSGGSISQEPKGQHDMNFGFANGANNTAYVYSSKSGTETQKCANYMKFHTGHFIFTAGNFECLNTFYLGVTANASATVTKKAGAWILDKDAYVRNSGTLVQDGGSIWVKSSLYVGNPGTGVLTVNDGTLTVAVGTYISAGMGRINLNGGTFKTKAIAINGQSAASASLLLNGGTIQAFGTVGSSLIDSAVDVRVGAKGGTINTDAQTFSIPAAINSVENTAGAFSVTGGGEVTFTAMGDFAGSFSVGDDTTLRWFDQDGAVSTTCAFSSLALGAGSTIYLDADATGHDALPATVTTTATADNPAMVKLIVRAMPAAGQAFPLFEMAESDTNKVNVVAETPAGTSLMVEKGYANGCLTYAIMAKNYVWNASQPNWGDTGAWDVNNVAADWEDNNNAVFNTADAEASLAADVMAIKLDFRANATVAAGGGTLTVPEVMVASDVSATINAPTDGALVKTGEGTLVLSQDRKTAATTLSEGTLALAGTASLDWSKFTFGTDASKPVTLRVGEGATLANIPSGDNGWHLGTVATSTVYKAGGDWSLSGSKFSLGAPGALASFYHEGGTITTASRFAIGDALGRGYFEISGGTIKTTGGDTGRRTLIGNTAEGTMVVKSGGNLVVENNELFVGVSSGGVGVLTVDNGGTVTLDYGILFNFITADSVGTVNLKSGGVLSAQRMYRNLDGSATFNFDGGTLVITGNNAANKLFSKQDGSGVVTVTVSENGGTIDNGGNANSSAIANTITGAGGLTFTGSGTTRVFADQAYLGTTVVSNGTTLSVTNVTFAGSVAFAAGSILNVASYTAGVVPLSASALTLPAEGTVGLTYNGGAFPAGVYSICSVAGVTAADGAKFAPSTGDETSSWKVVGGTLVLTVGTVAGNYWTGFAGDGKMSTPGNWADGTPPTDGEDVDFSSVTALTTIDADIANVTFGTVTMGSGAVVFTNDNMRATSFSDLEKVAVAANSTVTLDGDLEFSGSADEYICNTVAAGGRFVITGDIVVKAAKAGYLIPSLSSCAGVIAAKGLVKEKDGGINSGRMFKLAPDGGHVNWEIGKDGISGKNYFFVNDTTGTSAKITATANFTVSAAIANLKNLEFDAAGWAIVLGNGSSGGIQGSGSTAVSGTGRIVANYDVDSLTSSSGNKVQPFAVSGTATLAIMPGADIGSGTITVNSGATLEVAESGTVTLGCSLALKDSAVLGFNYTTRDAPVLNLTGKTVTFDEGETTNIVVKISAAEGKRPKSGANKLTSGGKFADATVSLADGVPGWAKGVSVVDGEIVLDVEPAGTMIIVR